MIEYDIYPKPRSISYQDSYLPLTCLELSVEEGLDEYTINKANDIIQKYGLDNKENASDKCLELKLEINPKAAEEKGYEIHIEDGIKISGIDTDMVFYGLVSLEIMLEKDSQNLRKLSMIDYPSTNIRGVIEGYYGVPWTWEQKIDLLKFGARFKNNVFIFAPKNDPYHRDKWFELYPDDELEKIAEIARVGNETKNRFVWTISPFHEKRIDEDNFDISMKILKSKLEQLYTAGVRQFGVLGDDVGTLSPEIPTRVMNLLSKWAKEKKDVLDFVYCPGGYNLAAQWDPHELNVYTEGFPKDVHIFFTGADVCAPIEKEGLKTYKYYQIEEEFSGANNERRNPVFWLNWPVNDFDFHYRKLHIGKPEVLKKDTQGLLEGVVTNPMQEPYASLLSIFSIADYSWNIEDFDVEKNYEDSFGYVDKKGAKYLKTIARHMAHQVGMGIHGLEESKDLEDLLSVDFENATEGDWTKIKEKYSDIMDDICKYFSVSNQEGLKNDIKPYAMALNEKLEASKYYIDSLLSYRNGDLELSKMLFYKGTSVYNQSISHIIKASVDDSRMMPASAGIYLITPFLEKIKEYMGDIHQDKHLTKPEVLYSSSFEKQLYYRIPLLFKSRKDTIIAICDRRNGRNDDYGNIDLVIRRKEKGKEFEEIEAIIDLQDRYAQAGYAFTIDSSIVQSSKTDRIFLFTTMFPSSKGYLDAEQGTGFKSFDGRKYLELTTKKGENLYVIEEDVYTHKGEATSFKVIRNDKQPFKRLGDLYQGEMLIGNIFLNWGPMQVKKTSYIIMTYSDDDGKTWSTPVNLNPQIKEDYMRFMGVSPGQGIELEDGRLIFSAYFTNSFGKESSCLVKSDDDGQTWQLAAISNDQRQIDSTVIDHKEDIRDIYELGETSIVKLRDGQIKAFIRNNRFGLPKNMLMATSKDAGESFEKDIAIVDVKTQSGCQASTLAFEYNDREYIIMSQPSSHGTWLRYDGKIHLFEVIDGNLEHINSKEIDKGSYQYSSLIKLEEDRFALMYEKGINFSGDKPDLIYREFDIEFLFSKTEEI